MGLIGFHNCAFQKGLFNKLTKEDLNDPSCLFSPKKQSQVRFLSPVKIGFYEKKKTNKQKKKTCKPTLPVDVSRNILCKTISSCKPDVKEDETSFTKTNEVLFHFIENNLVCFLGIIWKRIGKFLQNDRFPVRDLHDCIGILPQLDSSENVFAFISYWKLKINEEKKNDCQAE